MKPLPENSRLVLTHVGRHPSLTIPCRGDGGGRYLAAAFLLAWLGGWLVGEIYVARVILSGLTHPFLVFWLAAWTIGGITCVRAAFRLLRPSVPETLVLRSSEIDYDPGVPPVATDGDDGNGRMDLSDLTVRRRRLTISHDELRTLVLRETEKGNRLTIDQTGRRFELARGATEVEREWLFGVLTQRYA